jgi:hypothetical protein
MLMLLTKEKSGMTNVTMLRRSINAPSYEVKYSNGNVGRAANLIEPGGSHEAYQFGSEWETALYDQDPDVFAANYFGMTVPEYRKWVIEEDEEQLPWL